MTYENRLPVNYAFGTLTNAAAISDTTLTSADFATGLPSGLSTTTYVPVTLQDPSTKAFEIVWANAHTASATTATVLRGREGTTARAWGAGTLWTVSPTLRDGVLPIANRAALPSDPHVGLRCFVQDEQIVLERTLTAWIEFVHSPVAHLRQTVAQPLTNNTYTPITFGTEDIDSHAGHDTGANTSRYTAPRAGRYQLSGGVGFDVSAGGFRATRWTKNGVVIDGSGITLPNNGSGTYCPIPARTLMVTLALGDYVELIGWQNSGGTLNTVVVAENQSSMTVEYAGP